jgi:hypothetical protein
MNGGAKMKNALMVLALLWLPACAPEVPAAPTYATDVHPILMAHCVRCHGAGDSLNANPDAPNPTIRQPQQCYLQRFGDEGDCTTAGSTTCKRGAGNATCVSMIPLRISLAESSSLVMPPVAAAALNDWEKDVLTRWAAAPAP